MNTWECWGSLSLIHFLLSFSPQPHLQSILPLIDLPLIDLPLIDLPLIDLPLIDLPLIDLPLIDLPLIDLPLIDLPLIDLPAIHSWCPSALPAPRSTLRWTLSHLPDMGSQVIHTQHLFLAPLIKPANKDNNRVNLKPYDTEESSPEDKSREEKGKLTSRAMLGAFHFMKNWQEIERIATQEDPRYVLWQKLAEVFNLKEEIEEQESRLQHLVKGDFRSKIPPEETQVEETDEPICEKDMDKVRGTPHGKLFLEMVQHLQSLKEFFSKKNISFIDPSRIWIDEPLLDFAKKQTKVPYRYQTTKRLPESLLVQPQPSRTKQDPAKEQSYDKELELWGNRGEDLKLPPNLRNNASLKPDKNPKILQPLWYQTPNLHPSKRELYASKEGLVHKPEPHGTKRLVFVRHRRSQPNLVTGRSLLHPSPGPLHQPKKNDLAHLVPKQPEPHAHAPPKPGPMPPQGSTSRPSSNHRLHSHTNTHHCVKIYCKILRRLRRRRP